MFNRKKRQPPSIKVDVVPLGDSWLVRVVIVTNNGCKVGFLCKGYKHKPYLWDNYENVIEFATFDTQKEAEFAKYYYEQQQIEFVKLKDTA